MKGLVRWSIASCLIAGLAAGCGKKTPEEKSEVTAEETTAPASHSNEGALPAAATTPGDLPSSAPEAAVPGVVSSSATGVPADLAAADDAYEAWFKKHKLDLNDPHMLDADADGDGFTNRDEFLADTDPQDPASRPGTLKELRLKEFVRKDVPYVLRGVQGESAQIERDDEGTKRTEMVKAGQTLRGSSFKVLRVQSKALRDKDGNAVDGSHVTLEESGTKQRVDLIKDFPARSAETYAVLTSPDGTQTVTVHEGETFTWKGATPAKYKVKDLREEQVILEDQATRKTVTVQKE